MDKEIKALVCCNRHLKTADPKIYGHFIEHFHRQIYKGLFDQESYLSDEYGFRIDVLKAFSKIRPSVLRWPGGCFASAYHWKDGIGSHRKTVYDKAWRVEEPNLFGTHEFIRLCRYINSEPYICTNAGTGTSEEMSDWVEYCNLESEGYWAKMRMENGEKSPFGVNFWGIGNENYLSSEIGSKNADEWAGFVNESAKMMKRVDPSIKIIAAGFSDSDWDTILLREAGSNIDYLSLHGYWYKEIESNPLPTYMDYMSYTMDIDAKIQKIRYIIGASGHGRRIKAAYDEWNLRTWYHPERLSLDKTKYLDSRDKNDQNSTYTIADAIFTACFLNRCIENSDIIEMANFAPILNARGAVYSCDDKVVLRPSYHVFDLYRNHMGDKLLDTWIQNCPDMIHKDSNGIDIVIPVVDMISTTRNGCDLRICAVNKHPFKEQTIEIELKTDTSGYDCVRMLTIAGTSVDSFNDIDHPEDIKIHSSSIDNIDGECLWISLQPHSVNIMIFK